jgi:hypothetical protein
MVRVASLRRNGLEASGVLKRARVTGSKEASRALFGNDLASANGCDCTSWLLDIDDENNWEGGELSKHAKIRLERTESLYSDQRKLCKLACDKMPFLQSLEQTFRQWLSNLIFPLNAIVRELIFDHSSQRLCFHFLLLNPVAV